MPTRKTVRRAGTLRARSRTERTAKSENDRDAGTTERNGVFGGRPPRATDAGSAMAEGGRPASARHGIPPARRSRATPCPHPWSCIGQHRLPCARGRSMRARLSYGTCPQRQSTVPSPAGTPPTPAQHRPSGKAGTDRRQRMRATQATRTGSDVIAGWLEEENAWVRRQRPWVCGVGTR